jgi:hypothetical protein
MSAMKAGTEDKKKLWLAIGVGSMALGSVLWTVLGSTGSDDTASTAPAPVAAPATPVPAPATPVPVAGRPAATATARSVPANLDPTLHPEGMLLAERVTYTGSGRNIFLPGAPPVEKAAVTAIPKPVASARYVPPQPVNFGPPPPPPINLRFFGTATLHDGKLEAFLLQGDDVFVAKPGDIVSRRYRVGNVTASQVEVTDLTNSNTQRLPMSPQ